MSRTQATKAKRRPAGRDPGCRCDALTDPKEPKGYLQWHEWAEEQTKAGRRQKLCMDCGFYYWPKETYELR